MNVAGTIDRPVNVALGRQVHNHVGHEAAQELAHPGSVNDVGLDELVARVLSDRLEVIEVAGVGQLIQHQNLMRRCANEFAHHGRANEAGAACDDDAS